MTTLLETAPLRATPQEDTADKLVIVACSGDLERIWATLILATSGAASGMETTVFFTFWGLFALLNGRRRITGGNVMQRMLSLMTRGGTRHLRTSRLNFGGAGPAMMRRLARQYRAAEPEELVELARELGVRLVPCQMSMDLLGITEEDLVEGVEKPVGAATMLAEARGAATFFI